MSYEKVKSIKVVRWTYDKSKATKYEFKTEVESFLNNFSGLTGVNIEEVTV